MATTDVREIIGEIAAVSVLLLVAGDIAKETLANQPIYLYAILLTLAAISVVSILSDVRGMIVGGILASIATIVGYCLFDPDSLPILLAVWFLSSIITAFVKAGAVEALLDRRHQ